MGYEKILEKNIEIIELNKRIHIQAVNINSLADQNIDLTYENEMLQYKIKKLETERDIMKQIIKDNNLLSDLVNSDAYKELIKPFRKEFLDEVISKDHEEFTTCEWCGGRLYSDYTCSECGRLTETK